MADPVLLPVDHLVSASTRSTSRAGTRRSRPPRGRATSSPTRPCGRVFPAQVPAAGYPTTSSRVGLRTPRPDISRPHLRPGYAPAAAPPAGYEPPPAATSPRPPAPTPPAATEPLSRAGGGSTQPAADGAACGTGRCPSPSSADDPSPSRRGSYDVDRVPMSAGYRGAMTSPVPSRRVGASGRPPRLRRRARLQQLRPPRHQHRDASRARAPMLDAAIDAGATFLDTADMYGRDAGLVRDSDGRGPGRAAVTGSRSPRSSGTPGATSAVPGRRCEGVARYARRAVEGVLTPSADRLDRPVPTAHARPETLIEETLDVLGEPGARGQGPLHRPLELRWVADRRGALRRRGARLHPVHLRPEPLQPARTAPRSARCCRL